MVSGLVRRLVEIELGSNATDAQVILSLELALPAQRPTGATPIRANRHEGRFASQLCSNSAFCLGGL